MMLCIDEINSERSFQMSFVEYIHAISRLADLTCPISLEVFNFSNKNNLIFNNSIKGT